MVNISNDYCLQIRFNHVSTNIYRSGKDPLTPTDVQKGLAWFQWLSTSLQVIGMTSFVASYSLSFNEVQWESAIMFSNKKVM